MGKMNARVLTVSTTHAGAFHCVPIILKVVLVCTQLEVSIRSLAAPEFLSLVWQRIDISEMSLDGAVLTITARADMQRFWWKYVAIRSNPLAEVCISLSRVAGWQHRGFVPVFQRASDDWVYDPVLFNYGCAGQ